MKTKMAVAALIAMTALAACGKKSNETADTMTMKGMDTTGGVPVPVTDTVVKTTTTDTIQGKASDSMKAKSGTKTKTKTGAKPKY